MNFFQEAFNDFTFKQSDVFFTGKTNILKQQNIIIQIKLKVISKLENIELIKKLKLIIKELISILVKKVNLMKM